METSNQPIKEKRLQSFTPSENKQGVDSRNKSEAYLNTMMAKRHLEKGGHNKPSIPKKWWPKTLF